MTACSVKGLCGFAQEEGLSCLGWTPGARMLPPEDLESNPLFLNIGPAFTELLNVSPGTPTGPGDFWQGGPLSVGSVPCSVEVVLGSCAFGVQEGFVGRSSE